MLLVTLQSKAKYKVGNLYQCHDLITVISYVSKENYLGSGMIIKCIFGLKVRYLFLRSAANPHQRTLFLRSEMKLFTRALWNTYPNVL